MGLRGYCVRSLCGRVEEGRCDLIIIQPWKGCVQLTGGFSRRRVEWLGSGLIEAAHRVECGVKRDFTLNTKH